jgi:hypothetical protein
MTAVADPAAERLATLSDPVTKQEAADVLHVCLASVYESMRRFDAARIAGDVAAMKRYVPCLRMGGLERSDGTYYGGRFVIPRAVFVRWYTWAGLDDRELEKLYGTQEQAS